MLRIDDLAGKLILITGASSGIGAAISRAFAEQGARIAIHWNSNAAGAERVLQNVRSAGGVGELVQGDLTRDGEARRVVESSAAVLGGLDVLINNAGSLVSRRPFLEADDTWVDAVFNLNARAVVQTCRAAVAHLGAAAAPSSMSDRSPVSTAAAAEPGFTAPPRHSCTILRVIWRASLRSGTFG